ncbi:MAG: 30S ribosomal protein S6 [Clostridia bacterium]|nr:30S ribosomal protein S6 [Clostridia bacterium]
MNSYELLFIIDNTLADEAKEELITKFSDVIINEGGTVETVDKWGAKKLAYPINYKTEGFYVLMNFTADPAVPAEVERLMRINDAIIRQMVIKK